jgi:hypothetical protein
MSYMVETVVVHLKTIHDRVVLIDDFRARCQLALEQGLASDINGMKGWQVLAQYSELIAAQSNLVKVEADYITRMMRKLDEA